MAGFVEFIGYLAGTLATLAFLPQVLKTVKQQSTNDISLWMYVLFCTGVALWLVYGILITAWPIILANIVTLALASTVLIMKVRYG